MKNQNEKCVLYCLIEQHTIEIARYRDTSTIANDNQSWLSLNSCDKHNLSNLLRGMYEFRKTKLKIFRLTQCFYLDQF